MEPVNLAEYEVAARACLDPMVFDYYQGGAEDEVTLHANRLAWSRWRLVQRVLVDVSKVALDTRLLGQAVASPLVVAPMAFQCLACAEGELATARAAGRMQTIMTVSSLSTHTLEDIADAASAPLWFQLYVYRERAVSEDLVRRAEAAGYQALVVTVDAPVPGGRERDRRNRFSLPSGMRMANFSQALLADMPGLKDESGLNHYINTLFDPSLDWTAIDWLRSITRLPIVLKGIMCGEDARRAREAGAAALVVSNHGGRQLDQGQATADVLQEVVAAAGPTEVYVDGGLRRGTDLLKALSLGARAVLIGRPVLWGLGVDGEAGVVRVLDLLQQELLRAMQLCGCPSVSAPGPACVRQGNLLSGQEW
ncbi:MAG TPA: alpha-hydroxy acid oxidase [Candidatus Xenobia bacterium]|jgi:isopentenyl diphosphate isomerase/L-lactate dehydrogenase-like FMN-dependent dehydrogenase